MQKVTGYLLGSCLLGVALFSGCGDKNKPTLEYDRSALVQNIGRNIIQPSYVALDQQLASLVVKRQAFQQTPDLVTLSDLKNGLKDTWKAWQAVEMYEFGPAASVSLRAALNTWPADDLQIESNIAAGTWDLAFATNSDAKGFPALDYLLNNGSDSFVLDLFTVDAHANNRLNYLAALVTELQVQGGSVANAWSQTYLGTFESSLGTDVGSSTGHLVNQLNFEAELTKNPRIGIPLGKMTLGQILPEQVEAFYGQYSAELAAANIEALYKVWKGESQVGGDGYGLDDALDAVEAKYDGQDLSQAIDQQFQDAIAAVRAMPDPLSDAVQNQPQTVETAYQAIQRLVVLLKTDMASALGILITYTDNDGD